MSKLKNALLRGDFDSSSDDDDDQRRKFVTLVASEYHRMETQQSSHQSKHGGSSKGRRHILRNRVGANDQLMRDYFVKDPVYHADKFRRRFRMHRHLFLRILNAVQHHDDYFVQKPDATGYPGFSGHHKITAAFRMLEYGMPDDGLNEYLKIGESTAIESLRRFTRAIVNIYGAEYLRSPNEVDVQRLLQEGERRGFPGMLGSHDCMHWQWDNCPTAWHGQFTGHVKKPTIVLEDVASHDLWIWHAFFGMPGGTNDINVLDRSHLFSALSEGRAPPASYTINGHHYNMGYYLADGIYPKLATIVQTISQPQGAKKQLFARMQEAYRKDVERAFGVLQSRFGIVRGPARPWYPEDLAYIMKTCIILHNIIIEDERDDPIDEGGDVASTAQVSREPTNTFCEYLARHEMIQDVGAHHQLRNDLIEHLWSRQGDL